jgi:hypothetical protein
VTHSNLEMKDVLDDFLDCLLSMLGLHSFCIVEVLVKDTEAEFLELAPVISRKIELLLGGFLGPLHYGILGLERLQI